MMTDGLKVSILSAPLAAIDRRVLSQAWYSALHVARAPQPASARGKSAAQPNASPRWRPNGARQQRSLPTPAARLAPLASTKPRITGAVVIDRRAARTPLARNIERAFFTPRAPRKRATLTVGERRVHVTIATGSSGVKFVAVCSPSIRDTVARALAQARFALAARCLPCS